MKINLGIWWCALCVSLLMAGPVHATGKNYSAEAQIGLGFDSNAFLAPGSSYFDPFSDSIVVPQEESGFYIPLRLKLQHVAGSGRTRLRTDFRFRGDKYIDSDLDAADNYNIQLRSGPQFLLKQKGVRRDTFFIGPYVAYNKEIYTDRDTGEERLTVTTGESLAARFEYVRYGVLARYRVQTTPVRYAISGDIREQDYEEVPLLDSLDHTYYRIGGQVEFDIAKPTALKFKLDYFVRDYDARRARDLDGDQVDGTRREYRYYEAGVTLRHRLRKRWAIYLDYDRLVREDEFAGYNDYTRNRYRVRSIVRDKLGRRLRAELAYWNRDHPNTFAFDDPDFPIRDYDVWEAELRGELPLAARWTFWSQYTYIDQDSTDPRFDYQRHQLAIGVRTSL